MNIQKLKINNIPSIIWGEESKRVFIAVHGNMSNKEDTIIKLLADKIVENGCQLISFDLPEHGDREEDNSYLCKVQNCISDLKRIIDYARENYEEINLFACSMGAYFSLLAYKEENIDKCFFLSPIIDMKIVIDNMMLWSNTTIQQLEEQKEVKTEFGQTLYWDYYCYVKDNPIINWNIETNILYGSKDNMQEVNIVKKFAQKYNCKLDILEGGEHYFHTQEQLDYYKNWLDKVLG